MSRNAVIAIVAVIALVALGWYFLQSQKGSSPQPISSPVTESTTSPATESATPTSENVVKITASGFSPANITIKTGADVVWINENTTDHTVNSAVHPAHLVYPPLNLGVIASGESKNLNFPKAGIYKYHDHLNPSLTGSVTVE